ncbi:MAG: class I SAM-dependent methyltransferase [Xanthomonadales bacterium]|nr:class I SAM-dependent methyltransferase [Xanthomonadales bacterium]
MNQTDVLTDKAKEKKNWMNTFLKKQVLKQLAQISDSYLSLKTPGESYQFGDVQSDLSANITIYDERFFQHVAFQGSVGAAESYIDGDWETEDLTKLIQVFVRNRDLLDQMEGGVASFKNALLKVGHFLNKNTLDGSRKNIAQHYDLGNDLFELFLDSKMMYSSAVYLSPEDSLEEASERKLRIICEKLQLKPEDKVIEIGTGWGGFALFAAQKYGCHVTTTTISDEQYQYTLNQIKALGLENKITLLKRDYRLLKGQYDKLVSIEMIEAVGHHYLPTYLQKCNDLLKPEGLALIQAITIEDHRYHMALKSVDFIKKYIFPGSFIPSVGAILEANAKSTEMKLVNLEDFGESYAYTLRDWHQRFNQQTELLAERGYGKTFRRMWRFYFSYCEGGFLERAISDVHLMFAKPANRRASILAYK